MDRRRFLKTAALSATVAGCGGSGSGAQLPPPPPGGRPNVIVLVVDDLNAWTGYMGNAQAKTPHLDALAARSTAFIRNYCNEPLCNPSRSSAWSGLTPQDTKIWDNFTNLKDRNASAVLLPDWLAQHGYDVAQYGKINHSYNSVEEPFPPQVPASNMVCSGYPAVPTEGLFDWGAMDVDDSQMPDYKYVQSGIDFLNGNRSRPFMLCVGMVRTHLSWYVPRKYVDMFPADQVQVPDVPADDLADIPAVGRELALFQNALDCVQLQGKWADAVRLYLASIAFVDAQVGRMMAALDASAHADNTVVVLWSDNGFHLGEKFHWHKQALWEETTRVPLIIRKAGQTVGARIDSAVSLIDTFPTLLDLTAMPAPYTLAGRSLKPLLDAPDTPWDHPVLMTNAAMDAAFKYATGTQFDYAIRTNRYRYIRYRDNGQELYDDLADPTEYTNLASLPENADLIASFEALMPPRTA